MTLLRFLTLSSILSLSLSAQAATPQSQWSKQISTGKEQEFILKKILPQLGGGTMVFGTVNNLVSFKQELQIQSLQANGSVQWARSLPPIPDALSVYLADAVTTPSGGFFALNTINRAGEGDQTASMLTSLNAQGKVVWQQKISSDANLGKSGFALKADAQGGVIVAGLEGVALSETTSEAQCFIRHYDQQGQLLWTSNITDLENCSISSFDPAMTFDQEGNLYLALEEAVVKLNEQGHEVWRVMGRAFAVSLYNGTLYVTAPQKTWAINKDGQILWQLADQGGLYLNASATGLYAATTVFDDERSDSRLKLMRLSLDGTLLWSQIYSGGEKSFAHGLSVNSKGEVQVFTEVWIKRGLLRVPQPETQMLSFNPQGQALWQASAKDSISGASFFMEGDTGFYMADLTGQVTRFLINNNPPPVVTCPWFNPFCKK